MKIPDPEKTRIDSPDSGRGVVGSLIDEESVFLSFSEMGNCKNTEKFLEQKNNKRAFADFVYKIAKCQNLDTIKKHKGLGYEQLRGKPDYVLRLNDQYRVLFTHSDTSENFIYIKSIFEHDQYKRK